MDFALTLVAAGLTLVASIVLSLVLAEPVHWLLARFAGGIVPRPARGVKGIWLSKYTFESNGKKVDGQQIMELRQFRDYVFGNALLGDQHLHNIKGRVREQIYLTGTWFNIEHGKLYHGAFQFIIHPNGDKMVGRWVGFNSENRIAEGDWKWTRLSREVDQTSAHAIRNQWEERWRRRRGGTNAIRIPTRKRLGRQARK